MTYRNRTKPGHSVEVLHRCRIELGGIHSDGVAFRDGFAVRVLRLAEFLLQFEPLPIA